MEMVKNVNTKHGDSIIHSTVDFSLDTLSWSIVVVGGDGGGGGGGSGGGFCVELSIHSEEISLNNFLIQ
jgi:hypothetical protein